MKRSFALITVLFLAFFAQAPASKAFAWGPCCSCTFPSDASKVIESIGANAVAKLDIAVKLHKDLSGKSNAELLILESLDSKSACALLKDSCEALDPSSLGAIIKATRSDLVWWQGRYWDITTAATSTLLGIIGGAFAGWLINRRRVTHIPVRAKSETV